MFTAERQSEMIKRLIMFIVLTALFQGVSMADESLTTILEGIQKTYGPLPGLSVPYTREVITRSMSMLGAQAKGDTASGRIYFRHPHFLRLEQERPKPETIIANEDTLWWYIPEKKCAHRYPANDFGKELRLLSDIFRGLAHVEKSFQVVLHGRSPSGDYEIELIPDPPWEEIDRMVVTADQEYKIHSINIHNTLGTTTRFTLGAMSEKSDFEEGFFRFVAPEGVKVIVEGAGQ
jgi:outer membrane lipoprotein-sorting protein